MKMGWGVSLNHKTAFSWGISQTIYGRIQSFDGGNGGGGVYHPPASFKVFRVKVPDRTMKYLE